MGLVGPGIFLLGPDSKLCEVRLLDNGLLLCYFYSVA